MKIIQKTVLCASLALFSLNALAATTLKIGTEGGYPLGAWWMPLAKSRALTPTSERLSVKNWTPTVPLLCKPSTA